MRKFMVFAGALMIMLVFAACGSGNGEPITIPATQDGTPATNQEPAEPAGHDNHYAPANGQLSGNLVISAYDSIMMRPFLEQAAEKFTYRHPGVSITVESFSSVPEIREIKMEDGTIGHAMSIEDGPQERRDYINQINTELMSGRGPDILSLDILPFHRYARAGQLVNLFDFMENDPDFDINDYRPSIINSLVTEGELFKFPISINFRYLAFDSSLLTGVQREALLENDAFTFQEIFDIARPAFESASEGGNPHMMLNRPYFLLFNLMFDLYQGHFIDIQNRRANFTDGVFAEMLNQIRNFRDAGYIPSDWESNVGMIGSAQENTERFFYKVNESLQLFNEFNRDDPERLAMDFGGGISDGDLVAGLLSNSFGQVPFTLGDRIGGAAFGINANSTNQALAWEFIKFLSSYALMEVLQTPGGIPLHIGALESTTKLWAANRFFTFTEDRGTGFELTSAQQARFDTYMETVELFMGMFNTFNVTDSIIREMVSDAVRDYFNGDIGADDLANRLQSSITLVLNE